MPHDSFDQDEALQTKQFISRFSGYFITNFMSRFCQALLELKRENELALPQSIDKAVSWQGKLHTTCYATVTITHVIQNFTMSVGLPRSRD
jgi:hypothetical protein